jgi:flagellar FliJ protein
VINIAEEEEKKAITALAKCREELQGQERQLDDLNLYLKEYQENMVNPDSYGDISQVRNRYAFLNKLDLAISSQQSQIEAWQEQENMLRQVWMEKRVRCRALAKASSNREELFKREQRKKEQKMVDDINSGRSARGK